MARRAILLPVAVAAASAAVIAAVGGTLTDLGPWYQDLRKPSWQPPDVAFPIAWTTIFALAAASAVIAWRAAQSAAMRLAIIGLFAFNGFLNILWSLLFFRLQRPDWALVEVVFLWASILHLIITLWRTSRLASLLLVPYLLWVSLAAVLNQAIVSLNGSFG